MVKFFNAADAPGGGVDITRGGWDSIGCDLLDDEKLVILIYVLAHLSAFGSG